MWLSRSKIITFLLFWTGFAFSQTVVVQDVNFATWLCNRVPLAMDAGCTTLDTIKAESEYPGMLTISISNKGITNADEILFFKNVDTIYLNKNNLNSFPQDISRFRSLGRLNLNFNQITVAPDIHYTNPISGDTAVKLFYITDNELSTLPPSWNLANPYSQVIDLYRNELEDIPSFNNYPQIRRLDLRENRLSFEKLIPVREHSLYGVEQFDLFPQKEFPMTVDTVVSIGEAIHFDVSTGLASNSYTLLKNNSNFETNRSGVFDIPVTSLSDTGAFWIKIRNDSFPDQSDFLKTITVNVKIGGEDPDDITTVKEKNVFVFSPNGDGLVDEFQVTGSGEAIFYNKLGETVRTEQLPFIWKGDNENGAIVAPGLYLIEKDNGEAIKVFVAY